MDLLLISFYGDDDVKEELYKISDGIRLNKLTLKILREFTLREL